jgi:hypothetical protein
MSNEDKNKTNNGETDFELDWPLSSTCLVVLFVAVEVERGVVGADQPGAGGHLHVADQFRQTERKLLRNVFCFILWMA